MEEWDKYFSRNGCPYYLNLKTMKSQWEHPHFAKTLSEAEDYNDVIYAAYRTALKLLHIRNKLQLQTLTIEKIECAFADTLPLHAIRINEYITLSQLNDVITKLYLYCDTPYSRSVWTGSMSSCLLYFFDGTKRGTLNSLSVLVFLSALCADKLSSKYSFIFQCLSQHDLVGAQDISHLKQIVFTILSRMHEDKAYKTAYEGNGTTMTRDMFLKWLLSEPKFMVWLSTLHRIDAADTVRHSVKCYRCTDSPIVGLRYRCLQCFNVDLCFQCFARIPAYGKHDKSHSIEEYCVPSNKMEDLKAFLTKLRNNVKKKAKKIRCVETDLTARRQPATVWHDPKLSEPPVIGGSVREMITSPRSENTPVTSPVIDVGSRHSAHFSEGHNSLSRSQRSQSEGPSVYSQRYSQSLPRRGRPVSMTQSPDRQVHRRSCISPLRQADPDVTQVLNHSTPNNKGNRKVATPVTISTIAYNNRQDMTTPHYTSRVQHNNNQGRGLYAPVQRTPANNNEVIGLDFYSTLTRSSAAQKPISVSTHNHHMTPQSQPRQSQSSGQERTRGKHHNTTYSEDEGVVMTSESDSSVSQYPMYENRDSIIAANQQSQYAGRRNVTQEPRSRKPVSAHESQTNNVSVYQCNILKPAIQSRSNNSHSQSRRRDNFDYTKYSWDRTRDAGGSYLYYTSDYSRQQMDRTGNFPTLSTTYAPTFDGTYNSTYRQDLYQAIGGIQSALSPIIRTFQV